jgi:hypothetical protein
MFDAPEPRLRVSFAQGTYRSSLFDERRQDIPWVKDQIASNPIEDGFDTRLLGFSIHRSRERHWAIKRISHVGRKSRQGLPNALNVRQIDKNWCQTSRLAC